MRRAGRGHLPAYERRMATACAATALPPYTRGWFPVGWSHELAVGDVARVNHSANARHVPRRRRRVGVLDLDLPASGRQPRLRRRGARNCVVCPYHHWSFDQRRRLHRNSARAQDPAQRARPRLAGRRALRHHLRLPRSGAQRRAVRAAGDRRASTRAEWSRPSTLRTSASPSTARTSWRTPSTARTSPPSTATSCRSTPSPPRARSCASRSRPKCASLGLTSAPRSSST